MIYGIWCVWSGHYCVERMQSRPQLAHQEEEKKKIASTLGMLNAMPTPSQTHHAHAFNK
jgi:hypothetical protein